MHGYSAYKKEMIVSVMNEKINGLALGEKKLKRVGVFQWGEINEISSGGIGEC